MTSCPNCGFANGESVKFCAECGAKLPGPGGGAGVVRRTVTVLFADVSGSTALGERFDPESLRDLLGRYFGTMKGLIEHHGGRVEKFIGDAVMAVFGIPTLHEDDALRAVRAAAEIRDTVARLNQELHASQGLAIVLRTGVNTGEVVTGDVASAQTLVTGDTVNTAARLEQAAQPGEILLGESTYRLVRDAVVTQPHEAISAKGKAQPVPAFRLISVTPGVAGHARRLDAAMVGRQRELKLLLDAFDRCVVERTSQLVTLLGAAGVGKSRLVHEFRHHLEGRATLLMGRCLSYGEGITYWPLTDALRVPAAVDADNSTASWRAGLTALMAGQPQADVVVEQVMGLIGVGEAAGGNDAVWAVRRLLEGMARDRPLVLVIDDVHWATPTFLDMLERLAGSGQEAQILVVCVARPELIEARPDWGRGVTNLTTARIEPLGPAQIDQLLEQLIGDGSLGVGMKRRIAAAAEGNPLFVEELVAMLAERGELVHDPDDSRPMAEQPAELGVPATIEALIAARLDQLAAGERSALGRGSVVGKEFGAGEVAYLTDGSAAALVRPALLDLVRRDLLRPDPDAMLPLGADDEAFQFRHQLIRDGAYAGMSKTERARLHERYAGWLEELPLSRLRQLEEVVGYHLERAHDLWASLGGAPSMSDTAQRAAAHLAAAGHRAWERGDAAAAANLLARAAALLPPLDPERIAFLPELADALMLLGRFDESQALVSETLDATANGSDPAARVRAMVRRAGLAAAKGAGAAERLQGLEEALAVAEGSGDEGQLAAVRTYLAFLAMDAGRLSEARRTLELVLVAARQSGDRNREGDVRNSLGSLTSAAISSAAEIDRIQTDNLVFAKAHGRPDIQADTLREQATEEARRGRFPEARRLMTESLAITDDLGTPIWWALSALQRGSIESLADEPAARERVLREGYDQLSALGERGALSTVAADLADALIELGRIEEATAMCLVAEEIGASYDLSTQVRVRLVRGRLAAGAGDIGQALALVGDAVALADEGEFYDTRSMSRLLSAQLLLDAGRLDEARARAQEVIDLAQTRGDAVFEGRAKAVIERAAPPPAPS